MIFRILYKCWCDSCLRSVCKTIHGRPQNKQNGSTICLAVNALNNNVIISLSALIARPTTMIKMPRSRPTAIKLYRLGIDKWFACCAPDINGARAKIIKTTENNVAIVGYIIDSFRRTRVLTKLGVEYEENQHLSERAALFEGATPVSSFGMLDLIFAETFFQRENTVVLFTLIEVNWLEVFFMSLLYFRNIVCCFFDSRKHETTVNWLCVFAIFSLQPLEVLLIEMLVATLLMNMLRNLTIIICIYATCMPTWKAY